MKSNMQNIMQSLCRTMKKMKKKKKKLIEKALLLGSAVLVPFKWNDLPKIYPKKVFPIFFMNNQRKKKMKTVREYLKPKIVATVTNILAYMHQVLITFRPSVSITRGFWVSLNHPFESNGILKQCLDAALQKIRNMQILCDKLKPTLCILPKVL